MQQAARVLRPAALWRSAYASVWKGSAASRVANIDKAPPMGATPCVRLRGMRVCLGHTDILLPGTYKRTSYHFWYAVQPQTFAVTNVSLLFRFRSLQPEQTGAAIRRMGSAFAPRSRKAFDTEKLQKASGLVRINDSTLLVSYGVSACLCAQRHVCVDDVLRLLDRRLAIATL